MEIIAYSDGGARGNGKENNVGGWGAVLVCGQHRKEIFGGARNTTNNIMELTGALEALKAIKKKDALVKLHLDSAYVLNGLRSWLWKWKRNDWKTSAKKPVLNKELWMELDSVYSQFSNIQLVKVKGHAGIELNEVADRLANKGMDSL